MLATELAAVHVAGTHVAQSHFVGALSVRTGQGSERKGSTARRQDGRKANRTPGKPARRFWNHFQCFFSGGSCGGAIARITPLRAAHNLREGCRVDLTTQRAGTFSRQARLFLSALTCG